jgi:hypothetical protein
LETNRKDQFNVIDFISLGEFSVYFTQKMAQGKAIDSLIHYIDNLTQKEITVENWKATNKSHFFAPGFDKNVIV